MTRNPAIMILCLAFGLSVLVAAGSVHAQATNLISASGFKSFAVIKDRNIFNPNRFNRSARDAARAERNRDPEPEPVRTEYFTLLGTLSYPKGTFAYFGGSDSDYQKTLQLNQQIGDHTVLEIAPTFVRLGCENGELTLKVGMQLKRQNQGEWEIQKPLSSGPIFSLSRRGKSSTSTQVAAVDEAAEDNDILARLRKKRELELANENE